MGKIENRSDVIKRRLRQMAEMAEKRNDFLKNSTQVIYTDWYIRIRGEDFRAVSLNDNTPLFGFVSTGAKRINTIINHFKAGGPQLSKKENIPERRIQCWLIKQALKRNYDLMTVLKLNKNYYDDLLFALDEVSLGDQNNKPIIRCDILAVGSKNGISFPVLIELKSERSNKLINQLDGFCDEIKIYSNEFKYLLEKCSIRNINISKTKKMIVWPKLKKEQVQSQTYKTYQDNKIDIVEYDWDHNKDINKIKFKFVPFQREKRDL
ncbi:MAG: hypothetical protein JRG74_01340 [Deltaproteobacteria bacterium]|nr:hypothetical protein [Deltaproteobacteria bacterium]MBW1833321.1 hypothetical protein [Deltaproteobacteria bacterium]MBW2164776.1 hypothetical protein [Deltaproteobacteria bacterium]